jgi:hypothetical protein
LLTVTLRRLLTVPLLRRLTVTLRRVHRSTAITHPRVLLSSPSQTPAARSTPRNTRHGSEVSHPRSQRVEAAAAP